VKRAVGDVGRKRPVGMLLVGDGSKRFGLELLANRTRHVAVLPKITDREELAQLIASADALVHGCEAETFCLVAAEARASGVPLIVPDRGATLDQLVSGAGTAFRSGSQISLERAINRFLDRGPELQRAAAIRASHVRTMDEHFAELFARYQALVPQHVLQPAARLEFAELALARSAALGS
ncbi:MAG TPA: glycosyltransferase, partial [Sphingomicrobium sp.]|nr:glycosyltransferase [Sphingomicrobium sp.]